MPHDFREPPQPEVITGHEENPVGTGPCPVRSGGDDSQPEATPPAPLAPHIARLRLRNALIAVPLIVVWLALDIATKAAFNVHEVGEVFGGPFAGIFQLRLVHNTGAAWGIFADKTVLLGVFSLVVCVVLLVYLFVGAPQSSAGTAAALGLVVAGGIGNALDRFTLGYVVDFIDPVFIDFPVFNVADIGVTCGIIFFALFVVLDMRKAS